MANQRFCYYIPESQDHAKHGGYIPSVVYENEPGHSPLTGDPAQFQSPWVWGKTLAEAQTIAARMNASLGLTARDAVLIVASSMAERGRSRTDHLRAN